MKNILSFLIMLFASSQIYSQPYGQLSYKVTDMYMSSAVRTSINSNGHLMAGFRNIPTTLGQPNFVLYKTKFDGLTGGKGHNSFAVTYEVIKNQQCGNLNTPIINIGSCEGVTAIETFIPANPSQPYQHWYAAAGSWPEGIFFATFDRYGSRLNLGGYTFPYTQGGNGKPFIVENTNNGSALKSYFICGQWDSNLFIMEVNEIGALLWQKVYDFNSSTTPTIKIGGVIECPTTQEIVIVGGIASTSTIGKDCFFLKLDGTNGSPTKGNVNIFKTYGLSQKVYATTHQEFTDVKAVNSLTGNEYAISAINYNGLPSSQMIFKLDNFGNIIWKHLFWPANGAAEEVPTLAARQISTGQYEYYLGASYYANGIQVLKLDNNGFPHSSTNNDFIYNSNLGANPSRIVGLDIQNTGSSVALTSYGDSDYMNGGEFYMVRSYFNGVSGCNENIQNFSWDHDPFTYVNSHPINLTTHQLQLCAVDIIAVGPTYPPTILCHNSTLSNGSNLKEQVANIDENNVDQIISIYPNPNNGKFIITKANSELMHIEITDIQGRKIQELELKTLNTEVNLGNIEKGIYFVNISSVNGKQVKKIVIE